MKTFIKWSGNKSKHINKFNKYFPTKYNTYIEPFIGSGSILLYLKPLKFIINDINPILMEIWRIIKEDPLFLEQHYRRIRDKFISISTNDSKKHFCQKLLSKLELIKDKKEKTITYLFLKNCAYMGFISLHNKPCFYGLDLNIINKEKTFTLNDNFITNILDISDFLQNGKIYNKDYKHILDKAKSGDFVFLDPPYIENKDYKFNYNKNDHLLDNKFIIELYDELQNLDKKNVKWLMTQADTPEVKKIFKKYNINTYKVYRHTMKQYVNELVIRNYNI